MSKPKPPNGLQTSGSALWGVIVGKYDLRADELRILEDACREADLIDLLSVALDESTPITKGSMGQPVVNPLVPEIRQHRATLSTLLGKLKLPDDDTSDSAGRVSAQARAAANARWSRRGA
jgi:hypothetical protein